MAASRGVPFLVLLLSGVIGVGCGAAEDEDVSAVGESSAALESVIYEAVQPCGPSARPVLDVRRGSESSAPETLVEVGGKLFYAAHDGVSGRELWVTDGNAMDASRVKDVRPGPYGSTPRFLTKLGGRLYFVADDGVHGPELWKSDGKEKGTVLVADIRPGPRGSAPDGLTAVGGRLYFTADDGVRGRELWSTDGTEKGTKLVREFTPGPGSLYLDSLTEWNGKLVVVSYGDAVTLWVVDGNNSTAIFRGPDQSVVFSLTPVGKDRLFFLVDMGSGEADLWMTRNPSLVTFPLVHFPGDYPSDLTPLDNAVYFMAGAEGFFGEPGDLRHGGELWKSDGTLMGTRMVKDVLPGPRGSSPSGMTVLGDRLYFAADDGVHGRELWSSDGTEQGTVLESDLEPGPSGSSPAAFAVANGWLFFNAATEGRGREGWFSKGNSDHVEPLLDIAPEGRDANPRGFVRAGSSVYFIASDPGQGEEPWGMPFLSADRCAPVKP